MKKIQFLLCAALLVGALSAFTTAKKTMYQTAYGTDGIQWYQVDTNDINVTFRCDEGSDYCLYDAENGNPLPGQTQDRQFVKLP